MNTLAPLLKASTTLQTPSVLMMGPPGTGKTYSIMTLLKAGIETFVLMTEPHAIETVLDACAKNNVSLDKLHWCYTPPAAQGWAGLNDMAVKINTMTYEDLAKIKVGIEKRSSNQVMKLLNACANFPCERTGQHYGDITTWGNDRALVIDSLSGLNVLVMDNTVGQKPTPAQGEWGTAMNLEEKLILKLTSDLNCYFILIAHIDRVVDEVSMMQRITPAALGSKLGPKIGRFFSEVILTQKDKQNNFTWSTLDGMADLKNRAFPASSAIVPSFQLLVDAYRKRLAATEAKS